MTKSSNNLESRVTFLEQEVDQLREQSVATRSDAAAARVLAAGADHEVSDVRTELRAHTRVLSALRETQLEQNKKMTEGFTMLNMGMVQITALLKGLEDSQHG